MKISFFAVLIILLAPSYAYAMGALEFKKDISTIQNTEIDSFLNSQFQTKAYDYIIAQIDLNQDFTNEYILKRRYCETKPERLCNHIIIGKTKASFAILGNIRAKKLVISSTKTHNITDILAFDNDLNDYDFDIYVWSPKEKKYILKAN